MPHQTFSRIVFVTLILITLAAVAIDAYWSGGSAPAASVTPTVNAITSFDAALVRRYLAGFDTFNADQRTVADVTGGGITYSDALTISNYVVNYEWGGTTGTTVPPGLLMGDVSGSGPHYDGLPGTPAVSLPNVNAPAGLLEVPVAVDDLTGFGAISYDLQVTFDPTVLRPEWGGASPIATAGTLSDNMTFNWNSAIPGHVIVSIFGTEPLTGSGTLIKLRFRVIGTPGQSTALTFSDYTDPGNRPHSGFVFDEATPSVITTNGSLTVLPGSASPTPTFTPFATATGTPMPIPVSLATVGAAPGSDIMVPIMTGDVSGRLVSSYDMQITYDPAVLEPMSPPYATAGTISSLMVINHNTNTPGHLYIGGFMPSGYLGGSGTLIRLRFRAIGTSGQATALTFEAWGPVPGWAWPAFAYNEGDPESTLTNGSVTITSNAAVSGRVVYASGSNPFVPNAEMNGLGSFSVSAMTGSDGRYSLTGFGPGAYTVAPAKTGDVNGSITAFDAARISQIVVGMPVGFQPTGSQLVAADVSGSGTVTSYDAGLVADYITGLLPIGATGTWKFFPANRTYASVTGDVTGEDYVGVLMGEVSGSWTSNGMRSAPAAGPAKGAVLGLPRMVVSADKELIVPVRVRGVANKGVIAYEFDLTYDASVIQPQAEPADLSGTVSRGLSVVTNAIEPGLLRVVVYGPMPISSDGVLLNLRFTAVGKPGSASPLTWERIIFNEGEPRVAATNGELRID